MSVEIGVVACTGERALLEIRHCQGRVVPSLGISGTYMTGNPEEIARVGHRPKRLERHLVPAGELQHLSPNRSIGAPGFTATSSHAGRIPVPSAYRFTSICAAVAVVVHIVPTQRFCLLCRVPLSLSHPKARTSMSPCTRLHHADPVLSDNDGQNHFLNLSMA